MVNFSNVAAPVSLETTAATTTTATAKPVFWRDADVAFSPRRGFETALLLALGDEQLTADEVYRRLADSGLYHQVAPQAANLRPLKPINFLLKTWAAAGILRRTA